MLGTTRDNGRGDLAGRKPETWRDDNVNVNGTNRESEEKKNDLGR